VRLQRVHGRATLVSGVMAARTQAQDAPASTEPRRRGLSLATRLAATVLGVGFVSMIAATGVGLNSGQQLGKTAVADSLDSLGSSASFNAAAQLRFYQRLAEQLAESPQAAEAIDDFSSALDDLSSLTEDDVRSQVDELVEIYDETYLEPLRADGTQVVVRDVVSEDPAAVYLQASYLLSDGPGNSPILLDDAGDGSEWSRVHARFHPVYRNAVRQADLIDIYLVETVSERVVYSASKGPDLGTNLSAGPYRASVVARAAAAAIRSDDGVVTDLSFYNGVPRVPIGAAAAAVRVDGRPLGSVVLTYDGAVFTDRLTSLVEASTDDDSASRNLYLIGDDGTTRSDAQDYLADPQAFLEASVAAGVLPLPDRTVIEQNGTTVLVQPAADSTLNAALDADNQVAERTSLTGTQVVNVVERLPVDDVEWYAVSEIDVAAADSTLSFFRGILVVGAAVFVVALAFISVAWSKRSMAPVRVISERVGRAAMAQAPAAEFAPVEISDTSPLELHRLADSFSTMGRSLQRQRRHLEAARAERLDVMKKMLPPSVAQRIARGDVEALDEVPSATVVVVVVLGLGDLARDEHASEERLLLDQLTGELDDIAFEHGLDRIKVMGDSYFAACGHDRPYLDHAPRAVAFAELVADAVRAASHVSPVALNTAIGINSGQVTIGMSGRTRLVYDVYGQTVTVAHDLARVARAGEILVTDTTRKRLPNEVEVVPREADTATGDIWMLRTVADPGLTADAASETEAAR